VTASIRMTVYVDDWRQLATVGPVTGRWSHLTADSTEELHLFAERLGLPRRAFQGHRSDPRRDHYDVTEEYRRRAVEMGAVPVTWREAARMRRLARSGSKDGMDADIREASTSSECLDLQQSAQRDDFGTCALNEVHGSLCGSSGRDDIVDDENA